MTRFDTATEIHLYQLNLVGGWSYTRIAKEYGTTKGTIAGIIDRIKQHVKRDAWTDTLGQPLELQGDFMIVGDVHVPYTDWGFARLVSTTADKLGIHRLIVGGDMFSMDSFSQYEAVIPEPPWEVERDAARNLIHDWLETFTEVWMIMGNHDRRLQHWTNGAFSEEDIWGMITTSQKVHASNFGYCTVKANGQTWRITHPKNYRQVSLSTAKDLALKFQQNIISFHEHHIGKGWDKYGRYIAINGGMLADASRLAYVALDDSTSPVMMQGFVSLRNGIAEVYGKAPFTDWE